MNPLVSKEKQKFHKKEDSLAKYGFLLLPLVALALGTWQLKRLRWKEELIEERTKRLQENPKEISSKELSLEELNDLAFRRVSCTGRFRHSGEILVGPRSHKDESGFYVVTPFETTDGVSILVNRGWIPTKLKDPSTREADQIKDIITIHGVIRAHKMKGTFTPPNNVEKEQWFWMDIQTMANSRGTTALMLDQLDPTIKGHFPISGMLEVDLPNNHLNYAITWYSLGVALSYMCWLFLRKKR